MSKALYKINYFPTKASSMNKRDESKKKKFSREFFEQLKSFDEGPDLLESRKKFKNFFESHIKKRKNFSNFTESRPWTDKEKGFEDLAINERPSDFQVSYKINIFNRKN